MSATKTGKYTEQIKNTIAKMGSHANPHTLSQCGYTKRDIEKAVRDGAIRWTSDGRLEVAE